MSIETSKKKKGIQMPHTYIILFLIVLVVCLLTYVIPAGQGTYTRVESSPVSPLEIPMAFVRTLGSSSVNEIIFFIFIIGGAFELIMQTGMITAFCAKLGKMFAGKEKLLNVMENMAGHIISRFGPEKTTGIPGHQEIEIGLMRMYHATGNELYKQQARYFLEERGKNPDFFIRKKDRFEIFFCVHHD